MILHFFQTEVGIQFGFACLLGLGLLFLIKPEWALKKRARNTEFAKKRIPLLRTMGGCAVACALILESGLVLHWLGFLDD
jgi:hypothetical protein